MSDPAMLGTLITGLVSTLSAYMTYRVGMKQAEQQNSEPPVPPPPATLQQGEVVHELVTTAVTTHGDEDERADLANFERNPQRYGGAALERVLLDIAGRVPEIAQQLHQLGLEQGQASSGGQVAIGSNIAQADRHSSATVSVTKA